MKAVLIRGHGGIEALEIATLPKPRPETGQVVIKVMAAGLNHLDTWVRRGLPGMTFPLPMVLGSDASGVVEELGAGVAGLKAGDRVFVSPGYSCGRCPDCFAGNEPLCKD
jgi:NADPH:quinone reductase-like Zn-dependent oxidoreductase